MKLRQKLAAVLAATMVVTAVPVVTMAASTNRVTKTIVVADDSELGTKAPNVIIELKDGLTKGEFYLNLEGAEWTQDSTTVSIAGVETVATKVDSKQMRVEVLSNVDAGETITIQLGATKVTADEAKVIIDSNDTEISGSTLVFATKNGSKADVTVGTVPSFYTGTGLELAPITVEEVVGGTLKNGEKITIELDSSDFAFVVDKTEDKKDYQEVTINGTRGFKFATDTKVNVEIIDEQTAELTVAGVSADWARGGIKITGLEVKSTTKAPTLGELSAEVYGDKVNDKEVVVANVAEYGMSFTVKEEKAVKAGKTEKVEVTLKEVTADSLMSSTVEVMVDGGYLTKVPADWTPIHKDDKTDKEIIGFSKKVTATDGTDKVLDAVELEFYTELGYEGDVTLTASGRALGEDMELVIAKATEDFEVKATPMNVEVGVKDQKGGKIEITEADKAVFKRGAVITVELPTDSDVTFAKKPEVTATGEMKVSVSDIKQDKDDNGKVTKTYVEVTVDKESKEAATITVENFTISTDRTIADGSYAAKVTVKDRKGTIEAKDFITVGEGFQTITTTITNGATEMVVNGAKVALDAPAFLENGKMMVPLRAVAEAFGIATKDIVYNAGEIVVFANGRTVALTIGSTDAYVNGAKMTLANPAKIVNDRTTVPVGDLARLLGLSVEWDNTTKTATFAN